jgi:hypothetical protein
MAKKSQVPPVPEMTALPMTGGDSPLVIDLPDGQKLVVGNLAAGSVIEVATWRGTGRPDSRTSRLMLGMSSAQDKPAESAPSAAKKESSFIATALGVLRTLVGNVGALLAAVKKSRGEKKSAAPLVSTIAPVSRTTEAEEVDDWLNSILEKSSKKQASVKEEAVKSVTDKNDAPVKKSAKKAPAKKAVAKKATKKSTARRAR